KRVIVGFARVRPVVRLRKLRIGHNPIFRKQSGRYDRAARYGRSTGHVESFIRAAQDGASLSADSQNRSGRPAADSVIDIQRVCERIVIAVGKRISKGGAEPQMLRTSLR